MAVTRMLGCPPRANMMTFRAILAIPTTLTTMVTWGRGAWTALTVVVIPTRILVAVVRKVQVLAEVEAVVLIRALALMLLLLQMLLKRVLLMLE
jgi:hypothetical protein